MKGNKYRALFGKRQRIKVFKKLPVQRMRIFVPPQHNVYVGLSNLASTAQHCFVRTRQEGRKLNNVCILRENLSRQVPQQPWAQ